MRTGDGALGAAAAALDLRGNHDPLRRGGNDHGCGCNDVGGDVFGITVSLDA